MNEYDEMKLLQENIQQFKKIMQERIEHLMKRLAEDYSNISIEDKKSLPYYCNIINSIQEGKKQIEQCDAALMKLDNMEAYISTQGKDGPLDKKIQEEIDTNLKKDLKDFKVEDKEFLDITYNELAYENGAEDLSDEKGVEEYREKLESKLENGEMTEEFEKATYGMNNFDIKTKEEQVQEQDGEKTTKLEYIPEVDKGDNSYEEF